MVTGIETAGVVLATLPLCVEAAKAYARGVDTFCDFALHSRRDEALADFYDEFYWHVAELDQHVRHISKIATAGTSQPSSLLTLKQWHETPQLEDALIRGLGNEDSYHQYIITTEKIALLLGLLLKHKTLYIKKADVNEKAMFRLLKDFARNRDSDKTKSNFIERFRFFTTKKERNHCLRNLEKWNKRLQNLAKRCSSPSGGSRWSNLPVQGGANRPWNALVLNIRSPSGQIRLLTKDLYTVLSDIWTCSCPRHHEARFCLNIHRTEKSFSDVAAEFAFFVSSPSNGSLPACWKEGTVGIRTVSSPLASDNARLQHICSAVRTCTTAFRLRLLMENISGQHRLWKLDPKPSGLSVPTNEPPMSLRDLLAGNAKMGSYEKRELAVICAYSLLLLHDTPWISAGWDKSSLSFFFKQDHEPDFARPFISTTFETTARPIGSTTAGVFHRNSHILALGILLLEIINEKPVERWRKPAEEATVSADTEATFNLVVAQRTVDKMDDTPSTAAIQACLNLDWIPQGRPVKLEDPIVRDGLFEKVIQPLEVEISMVSKIIQSVT